MGQVSPHRPQRWRRRTGPAECVAPDFAAPASGRVAAPDPVVTLAIVVAVLFVYFSIVNVIVITIIIINVVAPAVPIVAHRVVAPAVALGVARAWRVVVSCSDPVCFVICARTPYAGRFSLNESLLVDGVICNTVNIIIAILSIIRIRVVDANDIAFNIRHIRCVGVSTRRRGVTLAPFEAPPLGAMHQVCHQGCQQQQRSRRDYYEGAPTRHRLAMAL